MQVNLSDCIFLQNTAGTKGGALDVGGPTALTITDCSFYTNTALVAGGAVYAGQLSQQFTMSNVSFFNNSASSLTSIAGKGGAVSLTQCMSTHVSNSIFLGNTGAWGGGLYARLCGMLTLSGVGFHSNHADVQGGAVLLSGRDLPTPGQTPQVFNMASQVMGTYLTFQDNSAGQWMQGAGPAVLQPRTRRLLAGRRSHGHSPESQLRPQHVSFQRRALALDSIGGSGLDATLVGGMGGALLVHGAVSVFLHQVTESGGRATVGPALAVTDRCVQASNDSALMHHDQESSMQVSGQCTCVLILPCIAKIKQIAES